MFDELAPMNVAELMDRAIDAYKKSFWKQIAYAAVVGVIFFISVFVFAFTATFAALFSGVFGEGSGIAVVVMLLVVLLPLFILWLGFSSAGHILITRRALFGHLLHLPRIQIHIMALRACSAIIAQIFVFLPISVAVFFVFRVSYVPLLNNFINSPELNWPSLVIFLMISLFIGAVFLLVANIFTLSVAAAMFEGKLFFGALIRSWELMKGDFWKIFGTRLLWYLAAFVLVSSVQGILGLLWFAVGVLLGTSPAVISIIIIPVGFASTIFSFIASFAQIPMDGIMQAVIYYNQRIKKDGLDMELKLKMLRQKRAA